MQKSVVQSIKDLCGEEFGEVGLSGSRWRLPRSVIKSVLSFAEHIPESFPSPTLTFYPPDKLVLEWWCGSVSRVQIVFQENRPVTYGIKTPTHSKTGKMMPASEFADILNSVLKDHSSD